MWATGAWLYIAMVIFGSCCQASSFGKVGTPLTSADGGQVLGKDEARQSLKLVLIGGRDQHNSRTANVTKTDPYKKQSSCQHIPSYPTNTLLGGTAENVENQLLVSCGGDEPVCYFLDINYPSLGWKEFTKLSAPRSRMASVMVNKYDMWITGGSHGSLTTDIINTITRSSKQGPDLPEGMSTHCAVKIDDQFVFLGTALRHAYIVDILKDPFEFKRLPDMKHVRRFAACGYIKMKNGERAVIVAGGATFMSSGTTSELYLIDKKEWVEGPKMPCDVAAPGVINPDEETFIFTAGFECAEAEPSIFQLDLDTMEIVTLPGKLEKTQKIPAATWVIDDEQC